MQGDVPISINEACGCHIIYKTTSLEDPDYKFVYFCKTAIFHSFFPSPFHFLAIPFVTKKQLSTIKQDIAFPAFEYRN